MAKAKIKTNTPNEQKFTINGNWTVKPEGDLKPATVDLSLSPDDARLLIFALWSTVQAISGAQWPKAYHEQAEKYIALAKRVDVLREAAKAVKSQQIVATWVPVDDVALAK